MSTSIGIGHSEKTNSFQAGEEAASMARSQLNKEPDFALVFCSGTHDPWKFLEGVLSVTGPVKLIGGSTIGVFTNECLSQEGYGVSIALISSVTIRFNTFMQSGLNLDEYEAGKSLARQITDAGCGNARGLLVFYDSAKQENPPMLNFATPLFKAIEENLPEGITIAGSGLLGNMQLTRTFQFFDSQVLQQAAVAVALSGNLQFDTTIIHGCEPVGNYHTITRTEGPYIYEIDNKPALEVIDNLLGPEANMQYKDFALFITLGINKGEKYAEYDETNYANRLCLAVDEGSKALVMFEPDLKAGDEFQLMKRSIHLGYINKGITRLKIKARDTKPLFYFYIDCAGRIKAYSGGEFEDAEEVKNLIGATVPFMGFYSGVEIAELRGHLQALDWTGVLCLLSE